MMKKTVAKKYKLDPDNAREHEERDKAAVRSSLEQFRAGRSIVVDNEDVVVVGNSTYEQAEKLGIPTMEIETEGEVLVVIKRKDLSPGDPERIGLALADNRTGELSRWDPQRATALLGRIRGISGLDLKPFDFTIPVFRVHEPLEEEGPIDPSKALLAKWAVERGQVWEIPGKAGTHRVMCGDSTDDLPLLMNGTLGNMIFTDPPYGVGYDGGMKKREKLKGDEIGTGIYTRVLPSLSSVVDGEAPLYLWYADGHAAAAAAAGYQIAAQIIWAKNHAQFVTSAHYKGKHEPCYYAHKKGKKARWYGPNNEVTLWEYKRAARNDFHPTQKPVALAARAIRNSTEYGQIVVDGFLGGGTTVVAAEQEGRICYGMEIEPKYVAVTLERLSKIGLKPTLVRKA
jgi:DNA modification methylase